MRKVFVIDLFCGAGGTTTGIVMAGKRWLKKIMKVVACVNHDKNAIASHNENHPDTIHFVEDIRVLAMIKLKILVEKLRRENPGCLIYVWASLECTNHSRAKGGLAKNADSRTLAEHLFRYVEALNPDKVWIENVVEFKIWGPLDENGKPIPELKGVDFRKWVNRMKRYGYNYSDVELNAADFGAYTSRNRYFAQFTRWGKPKAVWPTPTHSKKVKGNVDLFNQKWKPVKEVLDLKDEGISIFGRKKPLCENTLKRIYAGLVKFVANGDDVFTTRYNGGNMEEKAKSVDRPLGTILTNNTHSLVFMKKYFSGNPKGKCKSIDEPAGSITTVDHHSLVFMQKYHGHGKNLVDANGPCSTLSTKDRLGIVQAKFIDEQYGRGVAKLINEPLSSLTTIPKMNMVSANFLVNPQYNSKGGSIDKPCFTLIARMDKAPVSLISAKEGLPNFTILEGDSEYMMKIKIFMYHYGICDIKMRMLKIPELLRIQGFPKDYKLIGTQTEQKKYIGNAVECTVAKAIFDADYESLLEYDRKLAA